MKVLIKIEEYFPETKQIVVKFCSSQSEKSIDKVEALSFDLSNFNLQNTELFLESLAIRGQDIVDNYEQLQHGEYIDNGPLDISSLGHFESQYKSLIYGGNVKINSFVCV